MESNLLDQEMLERLLAYVNGELEEEERLAVERWMKDKPENKEAYSNLEKDYLFIRCAEKEQKVNVDMRRLILLTRMRQARNRKICLQMAASIIILITTCVVCWFVAPFSDKNRISKDDRLAQSIISRVKLILSTGKEVDLTKKENIQEQDGSIVTIDDKTLVYEQPLSVEEKPIYNKIVVPRGGEFFVELSDGTKVWLNAESELEYPVNFIAGERNVKLKGEAYFSVKRDSSRPFFVVSGDYRLRVYGTEFNLNTYHQECIQVVLVNGVVGFKANSFASEKRLKPNQLGEVNQITGEVKIKDVDVYPYIAWKNQCCVFVNERLESIMEKIERWYDVDVFFQNDSLKDIRFYGNIQRYSNIQELLFFLEKTSSIRFKVKDRTIVISEE